VTKASFHLEEKRYTFAIIRRAVMQIQSITKDIIRRYLPEKPLVVEAGAHIGRDTLKMALQWPDATIYAFEPVPDLYNQLKERTAGHNNIYTYNYALASSAGTEKLYVSSGASTAASSLLEPYEYLKERPNVIFHPIHVPTITLDQWAEKQGVTHIDLLWLDMQGAELLVLKASPKIVRTVKVLFIEISLTERFKGNPFFKETDAWLVAEGFKNVLHDEPKHNKVNYLYVRS